MPPEATSQLISASLWYLRSLCEQQLRALTDAHRLADDFREQPALQAMLKGRLVSNFDLVLHTTELVREAAQECAAMVERLPSVGDDPSTATRCAGGWSAERVDRRVRNLS